MSCKVKPGADCDYCGHESELFTEYDRSAAMRAAVAAAKKNERGCGAELFGLVMLFAAVLIAFVILAA